MKNFLCIVLFRSFFVTNFVCALKCKCSTLPNSSSCSSDGTCDVDKGACGITRSTGYGIQQACVPQTDISTGCVKTSAGGIVSIQCTCNDNDLCNTNLTQTDFGTRPGTTIKCKCSSGQPGCDSSGTCSTVGTCTRTTQPGAEVQQCSEASFIGCLKTKHSSGQESTTCGCENKDFCNISKSSDKKYIQSLLFVLSTFAILFNRF